VIRQFSRERLDLDEGDCVRVADAHSTYYLE